MTSRIYIDPGSDQYPDFKDGLKIYQDQVTCEWVVRGVLLSDSEYIVLPYRNLIRVKDVVRAVDKRWYPLFVDDKEFLAALKDVAPTKPYEWKWKDPNGYEVTSKGDKRFSPFFMKLDDGTSIENFYQQNIKGGVGKGKPCQDMDTAVMKLEHLMKDYVFSHRGLFYELAVIGKDRPLTDMFDKQGGQNKTYVDMLNNFYGFY